MSNVADWGNVLISANSTRPTKVGGEFNIPRSRFLGNDGYRATAFKGGMSSRPKRWCGVVMEAIQRLLEIGMVIQKTRQDAASSLAAS